MYRVTRDGKPAGVIRRDGKRVGEVYLTGLDRHERGRLLQWAKLLFAGKAEFHTVTRRDGGRVWGLEAVDVPAMLPVAKRLMPRFEFGYDEPIYDEVPVTEGRHNPALDAAFAEPLAVTWPAGELRHNPELDALFG